MEDDQRSSLFDLAADTPAIAEPLSQQELDELRRQAAAVRFPEPVRQALQQIWQHHQETFKENADEALSDRRFVKALHLLRISAASNGRQEADLSDLMLLKDCLWNNDENRETVQKLIIDVLQRHDQEIDAEDGGEAPAATPAKPQAAAKPGNKIKGYRGSGSESDPILIETRDQLLGLARKTVGAQGYYFRQTADIDCSDLSTWNPIPLFCGHYDGGGFSVSYQQAQPMSISMLFQSLARQNLKNGEQCLFAKIRNSRLNHMHLVHFSLATQIEDSTIQNCHADTMNFSNTINGSTLEDCYTGRSLATNLSSSKVRRCTSERFLVLGTAEHSEISDCKINLTDNDSSSYYNKELGGIAKTLTDSQVQCCYVAGNVGGSDIGFYGITTQADDSSQISYCAIGPVKFNDPDSYLQNTITEETQGQTTLQHNVVIDSNEQNGSDPNGNDGLAIAAAQWNAYYFEHTLGWDFDTVWAWDDATGSPVLREYQSGSRPSTVQAQAAGKQSLLLAQIRRNIWLNQQGA